MASGGKIRVAIVLLFVSGVVAIWLSGLSGGRPNILVIMVDDMGFNDLAINNDNAEMDTPNMDQLARDGVRFTRHYASEVCSPARAAFLTGMNPARLGYTPNGPGISQDIATLPDRLREAGYTTWHIGKWHVGDLERSAWPDHQGFDHWFGFLNQWRLGGKHRDGAIALSRPRYHDPWLQGDAEPGRFFPGHLEDILTDKAIGVISDLHDASAPWFLNLWFFAPHSPVQPGAAFAQRYPDTPRGRYRALVNQLDTNIGRIVAHLDALDGLRETIVIVVSDNGGVDWYQNLPYVGKKTRLDEGGLRTPLIVRWPGGITAGQVFADTVSIQDIYPSLLDMIGIDPPPGLDGDSFYQRLVGAGPPLEKMRFWETAKGGWSVLSANGAWRLTRPLMVYGVESKPRLFDLASDPYGSAPVKPAPPEQVRSMVDSYTDWFRKVHTVSTEFVPDGRGGGELRGSDLLRTPGFGKYTVGMAVPGGVEGRIIAQEGVWGLRREADAFIAHFGELQLSGKPGSARACHSVVLSGGFSRQVSSGSGPDHASMTLYIDGRQVDAIDRAATVSADDPTVPTVIGDRGGPPPATPLSAPVVLSTRLDPSTPWTVEAFSGGLCDST
jgi:arylsulfatase A-like enzyme